MSDGEFHVSRVSGQQVTDAELLADLRRVAQLLNSSAVSRHQYHEHGQYSKGAIEKHFGTWNKAIRAAGLSLSMERNISDERLFENLLIL
jgi:hypothetical protein